GSGSGSSGSGSTPGGSGNGSGAGASGSGLGNQPLPSFTRNLIYGDSGSDVLMLQTVLSNLAYLPPTIAPTTYFGTQTEHALLLFQSDHQLNKSGFLDIQTQSL